MVVFADARRENDRIDSAHRRGVRTDQFGSVIIEDSSARVAFASPSS
jgi:hypothetical protein